MPCKSLLPALLFILVSCRSVTPRAEAAPASVEVADLSEADARERSARVSQVRYRLSLDLNATDEVFRGTNIIRFNLSDVDRPLRLDFFEGEVRRLIVNGTEVTPATAKHRYTITLPAGRLKPGENEVEIAYTAAFTRSGLGLHRFVDPETKDVFLYSKLEPYDANRVFPCFDQPDLRSTWDLTVTAPAAWQVMHTTRESNVVDDGPGRRKWTFPTTPAIATYLFAMHAGPYTIWTDSYRGLPLRLWARPSLAKFVRAKQWFGWTKKGLDVYGRYFDFKYPFQKYDQIFVPEAAGAMENVAAVTFVEHFLFRAEPTRRQSLRSASVLLHEMAHMWFGDVVTMKWWNDLWLNESFATFMAALALGQVTEFKESWQNFFLRDKAWAYLEDGYVTTHPIEAKVAGVKDGLAAFDGITYGKGASVVKQLRAYLGPKAFDDGIRHYIRTHQFANTTLADFIGALQTQTTKDLKTWAELWLRQSGTDRIAPAWTCTGPRLTEIRLVTEVTAGAKFRPQVLKLGLFPSRAVVDVDLRAPDQSVRGNWACPSFVYPNVGDHGYAAVRLDDRSLAYVLEHLSDLREPLLRSQLWRDLWEMVRAGDLPLKTYVALVERQLPREEDEVVLEFIANTVVGREIHSVLQYWPPAEAAAREAFVRRMEGLYLTRLSAARAPSLRKFWFDEFRSLARTPEGLAQLTRWLDGGDHVPDLEFDLDRRWAMASRLARFRPEVAKPFLERLRAEDPGDRGHRYAIAAEAVVADPAIKRRWIEVVSAAKPNLSLTEAHAVMGSLFPPEQAALAAPFDDTIFATLRTSVTASNDEYYQAYALNLSPLRCEAAASERVRDFVRSTELPLAVRRPLLVRLQEDERCQRIRASGNTTATPR